MMTQKMFQKEDAKHALHYLLPCVSVQCTSSNPVSIVNVNHRANKITGAMSRLP